MPLKTQIPLTVEHDVEKNHLIFCIGKIKSTETPMENSTSFDYPYGCDINSTDCFTYTPTQESLEDFQVYTTAFLDLREVILKKFKHSLYRFFEIPDQSSIALLSEIEEIINSYEQLPVSYNQIMIRGTLRYCAKAIEKINDSSENLFEKIERFVYRVKNLRYQIKRSIILSHLDLTHIEDEFELIEEEISERGYLPKLENMSFDSA